MKFKMKLKYLLPLIVIILLLVGGFVGWFLNNQQPPPNSLEELIFQHNPYSQKEILESARSNNIKKKDIPFYCPTPQNSGVNECLMVKYQDNYGKGFYQGKKARYYNSLLIDYAQGKIISDKVKKDVNSLTAWIENTYGLDRNKKTNEQVLVTDVQVDSFDTKSNLANQIWAEISDHHLFYDSDYYEVLIFYNKDSKQNRVNVLGINLAYIDESRG